MKSQKFVCWVIFFTIIYAGLLFDNKVSAEEQKNIELSYKILESNGDDQTLTMVVKLRAKNLNSNMIYGAIATVIYTSNVSLSADKVYLGDISAGETIISPENVIISMNIGSSDQDPPQKEITWQIQYIDINGYLAVEQVSLK